LTVPRASGPDWLLERAGELEAIDAALAGAKLGRGRLLVIEAPAGIGKTALVEVTVERAFRSGLRVLTARGGDLEREFGFGVVGQLFEAAVRKHPESLLTGRAGLAAPVLGVDRTDEGGVSSGDAIFPALQGLYWLTVNLAEDQPLVLVVDDIHLADSASIRFMAYLAQRLDDLPVLLVLAARSGPDADRVMAALARGDVLRPQPLTAVGTQTLLRSIAPQAGEDVCRACHEVTGGNALFVRELAHAVRDENLEPGPVAARRLRDWSPERVTRGLTARLESLPPAARQLAHALAVLGQDATLRHAAALAGLKAITADDAADRLRAAGILTADRELEFVHPIVRAAVNENVAPAARARTHARAAALLAAERAPSERIAVHLVRSEPGADPATCATLVDAANQALVRGAPEAATSYLRRALQEPPPASERADLLLQLAASEGRLFDLDASAEHVRLAFETADDRETRLRAALLAAALAGHNGRADEAIDLLTQVRGEFADSPDITISIQAHIANAARFEQGARERTLEISQALCQRSARDSDATVLAATAAELAMVAEPAERVEWISQRGLRALDEHPGTTGSTVRLILIRTLLITDRLEQAGAALDQVLADSRRSGSVLDFAYASVFRADVMYRRGDLFESEADARAAHGLVLQDRWPMTPGILAHVLNALIERGELDEAEAMVGPNLAGPARELPPLYTSNLFLLARGRLRAAAGDPERALEDFLECGRRQDAWGESNPALMEWRSEAALAHHALGHAAEAAALADAEIRLARQFGAPRAIGMALRAAGIVSDGDPGLGFATEAVAVLAESPARLEHARALADLGEQMRGTASLGDCRAVLREALELAHLCGAARLERRILVALRHVGARPRQRRLSGPDALTPGERRVAQMAAVGMTNREIAESLFLTVRTIEFHLVNAYRKLQISRRRELRTALAETGPTRRNRTSPQPQHASGEGVAASKSRYG
jgi:DNA-binding NarL/FixJ family response regulator